MGAAAQQTIQAITMRDHDALMAGREQKWHVAFDDLKSQLREWQGRAGMFESRCSSQFIEGYVKGLKAGKAKVADLERLARETKVSIEMTGKSVAEAAERAEAEIIGREARRDAEIKAAQAEQLVEDRFNEIVEVEGGEIIRDERGFAKAVLRGDHTIVEVKRDEQGVPAGFERHD